MGIGGNIMPVTVLICLTRNGRGCRIHSEKTVEVGGRIENEEGKFVLGYKKATCTNVGPLENLFLGQT